MLRHAEVLYTRARRNDRDRAAALFRRIATTPGVDPATRNHCRLRASDIARGRATHGPGGLRVLLHLARALGGPLRVLVTTRAGRRDTESAADAYRALQQTGLRTLERAAGLAPLPLWPLLAVACRVLTSTIGSRAEALATNGNRRALVRQHRMLLTALAALLAGRKPPENTERALASLHHTYASADDMPGAANCTVALAVAAAGRNDPRRARELLTIAREEYSAGRPDSTPIPSGQALLTSINRILDRLDDPPANKGDD